MPFSGLYVTPYTRGVVFRDVFGLKRSRLYTEYIIIVEVT